MVAKKAQIPAKFKLRDAKLRNSAGKKFLLGAVLGRAPGSATKVDFPAGSPTQAWEPMWPYSWKEQEK